MKIVINTCYCGFGLSLEAQMLYAKKAGFELYFYDDSYNKGGERFKKLSEKELRKAPSWHSFTKDYGNTFSKYEGGTYWYCGNLERTDPILVEVVEELGEAANDRYAELKVVEIPDNIDWYIDEYDGIESIHQNHQSWH